MTPTGTYTNTPTATMTMTPTGTITMTPTGTMTNTPTATMTITPTGTITMTPTGTFTNTPTATMTNTPTATVTNTPTPTQTITATVTMTPTGTVTITPTPTPTPTITSTSASPVQNNCNPGDTIFDNGCSTTIDLPYSEPSTTPSSTSPPIDEYQEFKNYILSQIENIKPGETKTITINKKYMIFLTDGDKQLFFPDQNKNVTVELENFISEPFSKTTELFLSDYKSEETKNNSFLPASSESSQTPFSSFQQEYKEDLDFLFKEPKLSVKDFQFNKNDYEYSTIDDYQKGTNLIPQQNQLTPRQIQELNNRFSQQNYYPSSEDSISPSFYQNYNDSQNDIGSKFTPTNTIPEKNKIMSRLNLQPPSLPTNFRF